MDKAGEQPTIKQADYEAEAAFDRHIVETIGWTKFASMQTAASGADYSRGFKAGYIYRINQDDKAMDLIHRAAAAIEQDKHRTTSLAAQLDALKQTRDALRKLQPALNVMAREIIDDIITDKIEKALS